MRKFDWIWLGSFSSLCHSHRLQLNGKLKLTLSSPPKCLYYGPCAPTPDFLRLYYRIPGMIASVSFSSGFSMCICSYSTGWSIWNLLPLLPAFGGKLPCFITKHDCTFFFFLLFLLLSQNEASFLNNCYFLEWHFIQIAWIDAEICELLFFLHLSYMITYRVFP